ncbi:MAG: radical SAM protein [Methanoregula sp.]
MKTYIIYESRGRAREYCELAANLYRGCSHCCTYCYAPSTLHLSRNEFCKSTVRPDVLIKFEKDAEILESQREKRSILLSFTTDPYQHIDIKEQLTRKAIKILHDHELKVSILTKGGKRSERDFDLLIKHPELSEYGVTLVFTDPKYQKEIEKAAASTEERIASLKAAHDLGIFTYVSLEPVWFPEQSLKLIDLTHKFVDFYKIGKLNYNPQQKTVDWSKFKKELIEKLDCFGKKYYIKKSLQIF